MKFDKKINRNFLLINSNTIKHYRSNKCKKKKKKRFKFIKYLTLH